jgi:hypothetical protein
MNAHSTASEPAQPQGQRAIPGMSPARAVLLFHQTGRRPSSKANARRRGCENTPDLSRHGTTRRGRARRGAARQEHGKDRGKARSGTARRGRSKAGIVVGRGRVGQGSARLGWAGPGAAWHGESKARILVGQARRCLPMWHDESMASRSSRKTDQFSVR